MLKITKPFRYANFIKISNETLNDPECKVLILSIIKKIRKTPKNCLRCKFLKIRIGEHFDDFIHDRKTIVSEFEIIKFKRK